eukprot:COSAG05_NODE_1584_length_4486_cov_402.617506_5_plen_81_part_00
MPLNFACDGVNSEAVELSDKTPTALLTLSAGTAAPLTLQSIGCTADWCKLSLARGRLQENAASPGANSHAKLPRALHDSE